MIQGCIIVTICALIVVIIIASQREIRKLENIIGLQYDQLERFKTQRTLDKANIARCEALIESLRARIFELKERNK